MASEHNAVVFEVDIDANKPMIKEAVETLFEGNTIDVSTGL
jgi:large subunit ribosomal protein L23